MGADLPESMVGQGDERHLAMQRSKLFEFIALVRKKTIGSI